MSTPDFFRSRLDAMIDLQHPLAVLARRLPWDRIELVLAPKFAHRDRAGRQVLVDDLLGQHQVEFGGGVSNAGRPRLSIRKWLRAGVLDDGVWSVAETGTPQGAVVSPLLANVYLHYVFDLWAEQWRRREAKGKTIFVRYADDLIAGFEYEADARRFWDAMRARLECFGLELHGDKTRLLEFGRYAAERRQRRGEGRPGTFRFLGFTFICGRKRSGGFQLQRRTRGDRMRNRLQEIKAELRRHMHSPLAEQGTWLAQVLRGYYAYHAVPTNLRSLAQFRYRVAATWRRMLSRRSQKSRVNWQRMTQIADEWLPQPRILHPWPDQRFAVKHPRWEPNA